MNKDMNNAWDKINVLAPKGCQDFSAYLSAKPMQVNDPQVLEFLAALSQALLKEPAYKQHPELVALGFWLRPAHIQQLNSQPHSTWRKALGLVVHFTPANVDTMFIYSWVCSLMMGNVNIVRLASAESLVKDALMQCLHNILLQPHFRDIANSNVFVSFAKESPMSAQLSLCADARVMWGGDVSVLAIKALPSKPRCRDLSFADRYSAALINGDALQTDAQVQSVAELLWRDTQAHAQQACSSPRVIYWLGSAAAQQGVFQRLNTLAKPTAERNQTLNHVVVSQLTQSLGHATKPLIQEAICALPVAAVQPDMLDWHLGHGMFYLVAISSLDALLPLVDEKCQTLSYWQVERDSLLKLVEQASITGLDRVVPLGRALEFSPVWDGIDMFSSLSRSLVCL
jgi:hypothetical protein